MQVPAAGRVSVGVVAFEGVPEDLTQSGRIGAQRGLNTGGKGSSGQGTQFFEDSRPAPVELHIILKNHIYGRKSEHGVTAHGSHTGQAEQLGGERIGDLVFDVLRGAARPLGEHDLLVVAEIGDGIHRYGIARQQVEIPVKRGCSYAPPNQGKEKQKSNQFVVKKKVNDTVDHNLAVFVHGLMQYNSISAAGDRMRWMSGTGAGSDTAGYQFRREAFNM